jgi:hypothetical protein
MVAPNRQLLEWSNDLANRKNISLPHHFRPARVQRFHAAVAAVESLAESDWPERLTGKRRKLDRDFERKVDALIKTRQQAAEQFDIEGSLIAPRSVLESIVSGDALPADVLLGWQRECLGLAV